ncbi:MAG: TetR/AcrR family transcriptional regulator [Fibrobacterota bacterium]
MESFTLKQTTIVKACCDLVRAKGLKALTTKELARSLRVTEPALYRHFKSKSDILYAILSSMETNNRAIRDVFLKKRQPTLDKLENMYLATLGMLAKNPPLATAMLSEELYLEDKRLSAKVLNIQNVTLETIRLIVDEGIKKNQIRRPVSRDETALLIMGTMRFIAIRWRLSGFHPDLLKQVRSSWRTLKSLLKPPR